MSEQTEEPSVIDIMFKESETEEPQNVVEEVEEEVVVEEEEAEEEQEIESAEDDYEAPLTVKKKPEQEAEEDIEKVPESKARERAKIEGQKRKALETEKREWQLEKDRLTSELESYKTKATELEAVNVKPEDHPDYKTKLSDFQKYVKDEFDDFDSVTVKTVRDEFADLMGDYRKADSSPNREKELEVLKNTLASKMFGEDNTFDLLEKDERKEITKMVRFLKTSVGKADEVHDIRTNLEKRAKTGTLAVGVREYEAATKEFQPILDSIGDLPDEAIETNPHSIESRVALIAKTPVGKKRLESAKKDVMELLNGLRPLTQQEIEKMESNGTDLKVFQSDRQKAFNEKRKKLLPLLVQGLVARADFKEILAEYTELKNRKESEESEDDALRKTTKKKVSPAKKEEYIDPIDIMFKET